MVPPNVRIYWYKGHRMVYIPWYEGSRWYDVPPAGLIPVHTLERT